MMGRGESASSLVKEKRDNLYFVVKETKIGGEGESRTKPVGKMPEWRLRGGRRTGELDSLLFQED